MVRDIRFTISYVLSMIALIVFMLIGIEQGFLGHGAPHIGVFQAIYWGCGIAAVLILIYKKVAYSFGTIAVLLFGPLALLTWGFHWVILKVFPKRPEMT